jgi:hypothetical protein
MSTMHGRWLATAGVVAIAAFLGGCANQVGDEERTGSGSASTDLVSSGAPSPGGASRGSGDRELVRTTTSALRDENTEPNPDPWHGAGAPEDGEPNPDPWGPNSGGQEKK